MTNIRVRRAKPGLRRQHLTAVRASATIGNATLEGDVVNSTELIFRPGKVTGGEYGFDIGTAGSTTLVFQTVLPALLRCAHATTLTLKGGTHNHGGPPWDFLHDVFLPVLTRMGAKVAIQLDRHGFVPAGGGRWTAAIQRSDLQPLNLHERGELRTRSVRALVSNLPSTIADRELAVARKGLDWHAGAYRAETVESDGPGNIVMAQASYEHVSELATGFGQRGVRADKVAQQAVDCWHEYERSGAPVGEHLADQLLLPIALAGRGSFTTMKPTLHTTTNIDTIARFLPVRFRVEQVAPARWVISA